MLLNPVESEICRLWSARRNTHEIACQLNADPEQWFKPVKHIDESEVYRIWRNIQERIYQGEKVA